jgi:hypothetical protein
MELLVNGGNKLFLSPNQGETVIDITPPALFGNITAMAYATDAPDVAYVGTDMGQLFVRGPGATEFSQVISYPGNNSPVNDIAVDRRAWNRIAILSNDGRILYQGERMWVNLQGNIANVLRRARTIELVSIGPNVVILIGGDPNPNMSGVVRTINPDTVDPNPNVMWSQFGTGLAHANVFDLHFEPSVTLPNGNPGGDLLLAGTLGRGAWMVPPPSPNDPTSVPDCIGDTMDQAIQALADFSLRLGRVQILPPRPGTPANTLLRVVDQLPEPGTLANVGSAVDLSLQKHLFVRPHH